MGDPPMSGHYGRGAHATTRSGLIYSTMKKPLFSCCLAAFTLLFGMNVRAQTQAKLPPEARRIVFLGDSITHSGQYVAYVESYFTLRQPEQKAEFINVGLSSETVSGLSEPNHADGKFPRPDLKERLARVLEQTKPHLVFACYGINDGIYLPFDESRFAAFQTGMKGLHKAVTDAGGKIIHLTPPYFDGTKKGNPAYVETMARYSQWLLDQRNQGWTVFDIHGPMAEFIMEKRKTEPDFALAGDGVHPNDLGHWLMAREILRGLGADDVKDIADAAQLAASFPNGDKILALVRQRQNVLRDAWLTATKHLRPGIKDGLPLEQAQAKAAEITAQIKALREVK